MTTSMDTSIALTARASQARGRPRKLDKRKRSTSVAVEFADTEVVSPKRATLDERGGAPGRGPPRIGEERWRTADELHGHGEECLPAEFLHLIRLMR